jgi:pimeloyl-ACP methyl ester carboxylesterase
MSQNIFKSRQWRALAIASALFASGAPPCALAEQRVMSAFQPCPPQYEFPAQLAGRAQCATLTVPENRAAVQARALTLPVVKFPALEPHSGDPVLILNGGPGEANLSGVRPLVQLGRKHDVYYIGYRGADGSTVLQCPEVAPHFDAAEILSSTNLQGFAAASGACAKRLEASGIDLARYTIFDVISDLEAARAALGHERVNLLSFSYGTRVAQFYARQHPQRIGRSVMVGANPPGHFVFSTYANDQILRRLSQLCAADAWCSSKTDDLRDTVLKALHRAAKHDGADVDDGRTRLTLFLAMYRRDTFRMFVAAAVAAERGDWSSLGELGKVVSQVGKHMIWGDLLSKGVLDAYRYADLAPTVATTEISMGSPWDLLYQTLGQQWPRQSIPEQYHRAAVDWTPTLVINGDIDIATPLIFVEAELMPYLPNGKLLRLKDYGHGDIGRQGPAFDELVATYLSTGAMDAVILKEDPYVFQP